jgi:glycerate dehydrogenase
VASNKGDGEVVAYDRTAREDLVNRAVAADILVTNKTAIDSHPLEQLPKLKFISVMATGYNIVDVKAAGRRGIPVSNVPAYGTHTVAQYTMALILELCHYVGEHANSVSRGEWASALDWCYWKNPQIELRSLSLGIVQSGHTYRVR